MVEGADPALRIQADRRLHLQSHGATIPVRHARRLVYQLAEVAVPRELLRGVERIGRFHPAPG